MLGAEDTKIIKMNALLSSHIPTSEEMEGKLTIVVELISSGAETFYILI